MHLLCSCSNRATQVVCTEAFLVFARSIVRVQVRAQVQVQIRVQFQVLVYQLQGWVRSSVLSDSRRVLTTASLYLQHKQ